MAPLATLRSFKICDINQCHVEDMVDAIEVARQNGEREIINISLGRDDYNASLATAVANAYIQGDLLVASAGSDGDAGVVHWPARSIYVTAVSALAANGTALHATSNSGSEVEITAPGVITNTTHLGSSEKVVWWSLGPLQFAGKASEYEGSPLTDASPRDHHTTFSELPLGNTYTDWLGSTSRAAPHVSGVAALIWSQNPGWNKINVRNRLQLTVDDLGATGRDASFGFGRVNAYRAVTDPPPLTVSISGPSQITNLPDQLACDWQAIVGGGTPPYTYQWSGFITGTTQIVSLPYPTFQGGTLYLTVTDAGNPAQQQNRFLNVSINPSAPWCV